MVAFGKEPYTLLLASVTGAFHKVVYDPQAKTENCDTVAYTLFMDNEDFPGE